MIGNSWRLGRIAGIEIRVDTSWEVIALLVTYSLYLRLTESFEGLQTGVAVLLAGLFPLLGYVGRTFLWMPLAGGFRYLGVVNLMLAVFNMLPGFPLDGGRVLRAIVWRATGSLARATRVASIAGQVVGYLIIGVGVLFLTQGVLVSAIWLASIGWFLSQAARSSYEELQVRRMLESVEAEDLMSPELVSIPADLPLRTAVDDYFMRYDHGAFPVHDDGRTVGLLTLRGVKRVPQAEWTGRTAADTMEPIGEQCSVDASARMDTVLSKIQDGGSGRCLVLRDGLVVGIITPSDIARWLERRRALRA